MDRPIADEAEPSKAVAVMMQALEWGYEHATAAILPGLACDTGEPSNRSFDDPTRWRNGKTLGLAGTLDDFDVELG